MNLRAYCEERFNQLKEELALYNGMGILPVKKLSGALSSVTVALQDLKNYILQHPFIDDADEIHFFKIEQPRFLAEQLFLMEQFTIERKKPKDDLDALRIYYQQELKFVRHFFTEYKFQYGYYQEGATEMDAQYFLRKAGPVNMILPVLPDQDAVFSTHADYLFAKFMAYERLQEFILQQLWELSYPDLDSPL